MTSISSSSHKHGTTGKAASITGLVPNLQDHEDRLVALEANDGATGNSLTVINSRLAALEAKAHSHTTPEPPPDPIPVPDYPWFGGADPWAGVAFGSRPEGPPSAPAGAVRLGGDLGGRVIGRYMFRNRPNHVNVIALENAYNFTLEDLDFENVPEGVFMENCWNWGARRWRAKNIYGGFKRDGFHSGNLLQAVNCQPPRFFEDMKVYQPDSVPTAPGTFDPTTPGYWGTEDIINHGGTSGGAAAAPWKLQRIAIYGGLWQSWSGTGTIFGDGSQGHDFWLDNFVLVNPGQVGLGIWAPRTKVTNGRIWQDKRDFTSAVDGRRITSNLPLQIGVADVSVGNVQSHFEGGSGAVVGPSGSFTDLGGNNWNATLDRAALKAICAP